MNDGLHSVVYKGIAVDSIVSIGGKFDVGGVEFEIYTVDKNTQPDHERQFDKPVISDSHKANLIEPCTSK